MHKNHTLETFVAFGQSRLSCASLRLHQDLHAHLLGEVSRRASAGPPHPSSGGRRPQWSWRMWTKLWRLSHKQSVKILRRCISDSSTLFVRNNASEGQRCQNPFILVGHLSILRLIGCNSNQGGLYPCFVAVEATSNDPAHVLRKKESVCTRNKTAIGPR